MEFHHNPNVKILWLDLDLFFKRYHFLKRLLSRLVPNVQKIVISISQFSPDEPVDWAEFDYLLSSQGFGKLDSVEILLSERNMKENRELLTNGLPSLAAREILKFGSRILRRRVRRVPRRPWKP